MDNTKTEVATIVGFLYKRHKDIHHDRGLKRHKDIHHDRGLDVDSKSDDGKFNTESWN